MKIDLTKTTPPPWLKKRKNALTSIDLTHPQSKTPSTNTIKNLHTVVTPNTKPENQRQIPEDQTCQGCDVQEPQNCPEAWETVHDI